jgi:hypothetical protein
MSIGEAQSGPYIPGVQGFGGSPGGAPPMGEQMAMGSTSDAPGREEDPEQPSAIWLLEVTRSRLLAQIARSSQELQRLTLRIRYDEQLAADILRTLRSLQGDSQTPERGDGEQTSPPQTTGGYRDRPHRRVGP